MLSSQHHNALIADTVTMFTHCYENNVCLVRMWHKCKNVKYMVPTCNNTIEYSSVKLSKYDTSYSVHMCVHLGCRCLLAWDLSQL